VLTVDEKEDQYQEQGYDPQCDKELSFLFMITHLTLQTVFMNSHMALSLHGLRYK
jgi:hypothetical protein